MGYRHYVGVISKTKLEEIEQMSKEKFWNLLHLDNERNYFNFYDLEEQNIVTNTHCIGKLYWIDTEEIYNTLYEYKLKNFPHFESEDTEFFILKPNNDFFKKLAKAYWNKYLSYIKDNDVEVLGLEEKYRINSYFKETFEYMFENINNPSMLSRSNEYSFMTYNWMHLHKTFDYDNNIIFVSAW